MTQSATINAKLFVAVSSAEDAKLLKFSLVIKFYDWYESARRERD